MIWLVLLSAGGCAARTDRAGTGKPAPAAEKVAAARVVVAEARQRTWPHMVHVQGSLLSDERVIVGAKVAGRIASLGEDLHHEPIDLGSEVRAGDVLARLEAEEFELKVRQAESQLEQVRATLGLEPAEDESKLDRATAPTVVQEKVLWDEARANWERAEALNRQTAISAEELQQRKALVDVAAARYESALYGVDESLALLGVRRAEVALARQTLMDAEIRAPFGGVVEQRHVAPGAFVQVGQPIATLVKVDPWRYRAYVPEREASAVRLGQPVSIHLEGEPRPLEAEIAHISPSLDLGTRSLAVEAVRRPSAPAADSDHAPSPRRDALVRRGLFAEADIIVDATATTLAVPVAAVREFAGVEKVWLVANGEATEKPVTTGRRDERFVEILDGLAVGDLVVTEHAPKQAGPVEVLKKSASD